LLSLIKPHDTAAAPYPNGWISTDDGRSEEAQADVRAIGTNGIPSILKWIGQDAREHRLGQLMLHTVPKGARKSPFVMRLSGIVAASQCIRYAWNQCNLGNSTTRGIEQRYQSPSDGLLRNKRAEFAPATRLSSNAGSHE